MLRGGGECDGGRSPQFRLHCGGRACAKPERTRSTAAPARAVDGPGPAAEPRGAPAAPVALASGALHRGVRRPLPGTARGGSGRPPDTRGTARLRGRGPCARSLAGPGSRARPSPCSPRSSAPSRERPGPTSRSSSRGSCPAACTRSSAPSSASRAATSTATGSSISPRPATVSSTSSRRWSSGSTSPSPTRPPCRRPRPIRSGEQRRRDRDHGAGRSAGQGEWRLRLRGDGRRRDGARRGAARVRPDLAQAPDRPMNRRSPAAGGAQAAADGGASGPSPP
jgi:hypothetical protein